jgi:Na+/H+ antiporter NhaD/arsenite permease-like protein
LLAGVLGTTGVSMVLIHPLLRANRHRQSRQHLVVFFIMLCANAGGITSPLGDPPLYLGFLRGVPFFWPLTHLGLLLLMVAGPLLAVFYLIDRHLAVSQPAPEHGKLRLQGRDNLVLLVLVIGVVICQGIWHPGEVIILGAPIDIERLLAMCALLGITGASYFGTASALRGRNLFSWGPMREVAILFAAIFVTVIPVQVMLHAGAHGPLAPLLRLATTADGQPSPFAYFWLTGALAAVLDNAPTYLVFFQLAGDDPAWLTGAGGEVLRAISAGAVFFGGLTYIGNAPNMLVRSIAAHRGVAMPGFFAYTAAAATMLGPLLVVVSLVWF